MNPATQAGLFSAAVVIALKAIYELVMMVKNQSASKKTSCNYPERGGGCAFASHDFHQMRKVEIVQGVSNELRPALEEQNRLLGQIRDGVRDMR